MALRLCYFAGQECVDGGGWNQDGAEPLRARKLPARYQSLNRAPRQSDGGREFVDPVCEARVAHVSSAACEGGREGDDGASILRCSTTKVRAHTHGLIDHASLP